MPTKDQMLKERLFAPDDVAAYYNISRRTVYNLVKIGALRTIRIGGAIRFRPSDIEEYVASQTEPSISDMAQYSYAKRKSKEKNVTVLLP